MMVVRDDRDGEAVPPACQQGRRPDVAERMHPEEVEARRRIDALDDRWQEQRGHRPAESTADRKPVDRPVRNSVGVALVTGEENVADNPTSGEVPKQLPLVSLPTRRGLRIDPAVGRADPHACSLRTAISSTYGRIRKRP